MRLVNASTFKLEEFYDEAVPLYGILSHTWESDEVSFRDMQDLPAAKLKKGFRKIRYACEQALKGTSLGVPMHYEGLYEPLNYVWVDTCCIDKSSSAELYEWYGQAIVCFVYLADIDGSCPELTKAVISNDACASCRESFMKSRWFTRGWTLQELIAPMYVVFYASVWNLLGDKRQLVTLISKATTIDTQILKGSVRPSSRSVAQRMSWAAHRKTSKVEDQAYCLLGILEVNMPMLYGERTKAFQRLQEEVMKVSADHTIFAWEHDQTQLEHPSPDMVSVGSTTEANLLASSPANFANAGDMVQWGESAAFEMTNRGLRIELPTLILPASDPPRYLAVVNCRRRGELLQSRALCLQPYHDGHGFHISMTEESLSRLAIVGVEDMDKAENTTLHVSRKFEPRASRYLLKFLVRLTNDGEDPYPANVVEAYTSCGVWDVK